MTREEAIRQIENRWSIMDYGESEALGEALDMAIEALSAKPTISMFAESEEAYKAWTGEEMGKTGDEINEMNKEIIKDILKMMPTAYLLEALGVSTFEELTEQADRPIKAIQDCRNCKYGKYNERYSEYFCYHNGECVNYDLWESGEEIADRPHGEWIQSDIPNEKYVCSNCGAPCWYYDVEKDVCRSRFCPNCGAKMGGDDE